MTLLLEPGFSKPATLALYPSGSPSPPGALQRLLPDPAPPRFLPPQEPPSLRVFPGDGPQALFILVGPNWGPVHVIS